MTPIRHKNFRGSVDDFYFDPETGDIDLFTKTTNLTPFRKIGSIVQCCGFTEYLSSANIPSIANYVPIKIYNFSVDRENKEITLVVLKNGDDDIKMFLSSYWNPDSSYHNHKTDKTAESWIDEWIEITEKLETINSNPILIDSMSGENITIDDNFPNSTPYYAGWFVFNHTVSESLFGAKFGMVHVQVDDNTFFADANVAEWNDGDQLSFFRFPVTALYNMLPNYTNYDNFSGDFTAVPTQFIDGHNELRIACGKENRPLIIQDIFERKFLAGERYMSYDGLWFDFEQPQQNLRNSAISSYGDAVSSASSDEIFVDTGLSDCFSAVAPAYRHLSIKYIGSSVENLQIIGTNTTTPTISYHYSNGHVIELFCGGVGAATLTELKSLLDEYFSGIFEVTYVIGNGLEGSFGLSSYDSEHTFVYGGSTTLGYDAGDNQISTNIFLGCQSEANNYQSVSDPANRVILTLLTDNRNEVLISHGNICSSPTGLLKGGVNLKFNAWFNRRITHIRVYSGTEAELSAPGVFAIPYYPYFAWANGYKINETPLLATMPFENLNKPINGELTTVNSAVSLTHGINCFIRDEGLWITKICKDGVKINEKGKGFKYIVSCNRYIDQDITMNYTRGVFTGQVNGRIFIIGCKNTVESEVFENDDLVLMSIYCAGVSSYDIFLRDRNLQVNLGNKDINREISLYRNKLFVVRDTNVYPIDISQRNEINYKVLDTLSGRGTTSPDGVCQTPYGMIVCSSDTVWLFGLSGVSPLLVNSNGRLKLYKDKFANKVLKTVYYNEYDEVMIFSLDEDSRESGVCNVLIYSFRSKHWTNYEYLDSVYPIDVTLSEDKEILVLSGIEGDFNIVKYDESSSSFISPDGTSIPIHWELESLTYPYSFSTDAVAQWIEFNIGHMSDEVVLRLIVSFDNDVNKITDYINISSQPAILKNDLKLILLNDILFRHIAFNLSNKDNLNNSQEFNYFCLNNIILWIDKIRIKKITNG